MSFCLTTNAFTHSLYSNNTTVMSETKWKVNTSSIHEIAMSNSINSNCYHSARHPQFWSENKGRWAIVDLIWLECRKKWTDCIKLLTRAISRATERQIRHLWRKIFFSRSSSPISRHRFAAQILSDKLDPSSTYVCLRCSPYTQAGKLFYSSDVRTNREC